LLGETNFTPETPVRYPLAARLTTESLPRSVWNEQIPTRFTSPTRRHRQIARLTGIHEHLYIVRVAPRDLLRRAYVLSRLEVLPVLGSFDIVGIIL